MESQNITDYARICDCRDELLLSDQTDSNILEIKSMLRTTDILIEDFANAANISKPSVNLDEYKNLQDYYKDPSSFEIPK